MHSERIILETTDNTRTLSNLSNREGKHIKRHLLLRSDALWRLNASDEKILKEEYGLKRIIDLRCEDEISHKPDVILKDVSYIKNPILPNERLGITKTGNQKNDIEDFIRMLKKSGIESSKQFMNEVYRELVRSSFSNEAYKHFLNLLLEPVEGATLWHCSAGKDRVGFATFLVLYLLDFDRNTIIEDFLATNLFYENAVQYHLGRLGEEYADILWCVFGVHKEYIEIITEELTKQFGGIEPYVKNVLGFDDEKRAMFKSLYLEG